MKGQSLKPREVSLKRGDRVSIYQTIYYPNINGKPGGAATCWYAYGVVMRAYEHIGAMVVRTDKRSTFIKENDPEWSVYIEQSRGSATTR